MCCKVGFVSFLAVEENCLAVSRVILRTLDEWKCFRYLEKVILWSRLCLAKDEFKYHRKHVYFIQKMCFLPQRKWPAIKDPLRGKNWSFSRLYYFTFCFILCKFRIDLTFPFIVIIGRRVCLMKRLLRQIHLR